MSLLCAALPTHNRTASTPHSLLAGPGTEEVSAFRADGTPFARLALRLRTHDPSLRIGVDATDAPPTAS